VFCIFAQSPENSGELGTPSEYAEAYRHVVSVFRSAGATNIRWIFNLKSPTFAEDADLYYPGDDVIDWLGTSAYNFGIGNPGGRWFSFAALIEDFISWATPHGKPLIVTEWNSREDPDDPDAKAKWIEEAAAKVEATPQIRAMSAFWSVVDGMGFDSSASSLEAFRAFAKRPYTNLRQVTRDELLLNP
jgi:beta-mannanase